MPDILRRTRSERVDPIWQDQDTLVRLAELLQRYAGGAEPARLHITIQVLGGEDEITSNSASVFTDAATPRRIGRVKIEARSRDMECSVDLDNHVEGLGMPKARLKVSGNSPQAVAGAMSELRRELDGQRTAGRMLRTVSER